MRSMAVDSEARKVIIRARWIYAAFLVSLFIYGDLVVRVVKDGGVFNDNHRGLVWAAVAFLALLGLSGALIARLISMPHLIATIPEQRMKQVHAIYKLQAAFYEAIGIYGFILSMLGAPVWVAAIFFAVSGVALVLTFPRARTVSLWLQSWQTSKV